VGAQLKRTGRESHRDERLLHVDRGMAITNLSAATAAVGNGRHGVGSAVGFTPRAFPRHV